jgi:hypothetical protein
MRIECTSCEMYQTEHCDDCLVNALLHPPTGAVDIDDELDDSLEALSLAGLIPVLRFRPRSTDVPAETDLPPPGEVADAG